MQGARRAGGVSRVVVANIVEARHAEPEMSCRVDGDRNKTTALESMPASPIPVCAAEHNGCRFVDRQVANGIGRAMATLAALAAPARAIHCGLHLTTEE